MSKRLTDPVRLLDALKKANARGVNIFFLINQKLDYIKPKREHQKLAQILRSTGIKYRLYNKNNIQHAKVFLIDNSICYVGSHNLTQGAVNRNLDITIRLESRSLYSELAILLLDACAPPFPVLSQKVE